MPRGSAAVGRPVREDFLVFGAPAIGEEEIAEVVATLRSGWVGTGPKVKEFEARFGRYVEAEHAVAVSSCTAGLTLALEVLGVGRGDEVITTSMTFPATAAAVIHRGATPVFADVDPATLNVDPTAVERLIGSRTRAILPVHMAGRACEMADLLEIGRAHGVPVVSDAAHAVETRYGGRPVGALGDLVAFSFYTTKNLTTVEGGMVTTWNSEWAEALSVRSLHGLSRDAWTRYTASGYRPYEAVCAGYKANMTDLQASLGLHQLDRLESNWQVRRRHWLRYKEALGGLRELTLPEVDFDGDGRHALHLFTVMLDLDRLELTRDEFVSALAAENIGAGVHYTPVHLHCYYRERFGHRPGELPGAEWVGERTVSLPLSPGLSEEDVEDVIHAVHKLVALHSSVRRFSVA